MAADPTVVCGSLKCLYEPKNMQMTPERQLNVGVMGISCSSPPPCVISPLYQSTFLTIKFQCKIIKRVKCHYNVSAF